MSISGGKHDQNGLKPEQMKFQVDQKMGSLQNPDKEPQKEVRGQVPQMVEASYSNLLSRIQWCNAW